MGPLIRWEPTAGMSRLRDEMNRLLEDFFGEVSEERMPSEVMRVPTIDVVDKDNEVLVRAEMPGIDKDNLKIEATPDAVLLRADVKKEHEEKKDNFIRRERRVSTYQRIIPMPVEIKPSGVKASYHDGVLEVTLPKSDQAKSRQPVRVKVD